MPDIDWVESVRVPQPAAGANATRRVQGETFERLEIVRCTLVASGAAANRFVAVDYLDGDDTVIARVQSGTAVTAGLTTAFTFGKDVSIALNSGTSEQLLPLIGSVLPPGFKVRINVVNRDVADQLSSIVFHVCRYPSGLWVPSGGASPYEP